MEPTATAHRAWDARWQTAAGRAQWLDADPDVAAAAEALAGRGGGRVLDLGCGVGRHALVFAALGLETFALDGSAAGLAHLDDCARTGGLRVETCLGQMTELPFPEAFFDYLLAFNVIYHGDPGVVRQTIAEIRRVLKPGGLYQGTMLSKRNEKFGRGREIAPDTFVIDGEEEKSHAHFYCNAGELVGLFEGFELLALEDREHGTPGSWHWHLKAERLAEAGG